jgi:hypothetical protein
MKRRTLALLVALSLVAGMLPAAVFAADTGTVTCTVAATLVSLSVEDGSIDYGVLNLAEQKNTAAYDETYNPDGMTTPQTQTITNTGTVQVNLEYKSSDAAGATNWTLSVVSGDDEFQHAFHDGPTPYEGGEAIFTFTPWNLADTYYWGGLNVTPGTSRYLDLQIRTPSPVTDYGSHNITVTVRAVQS